MGNNQSNKEKFEHEEQKETNYIISFEDYWNVLNQMMNKMFIIYWSTDVSRDNANKIDAFIFDSKNTFDDKINKIVQFEKAILLFFEKYDKDNYDRLWKDYIKTYFSWRTGNVSPTFSILIIDSFIGDKYNEVTFSSEELAKQSQNIYIQLNYLSKHIWKDGQVTEESANFMKVIKVYLLL